MIGEWLTDSPGVPEALDVLELRSLYSDDTIPAAQRNRLAAAPLARQGLELGDIVPEWGEFDLWSGFVEHLLGSVGVIPKDRYLLQVLKRGSKLDVAFPSGPCFNVTPEMEERDPSAFGLDQAWALVFLKGDLPTEEAFANRMTIQRFPGAEPVRLEEVCLMEDGRPLVATIGAEDERPDLPSPVPGYRPEWLPLRREVAGGDLIRGRYRCDPADVRRLSDHTPWYVIRSFLLEYRKQRWGIPFPEDLEHVRTPDEMREELAPYVRDGLTLVASIDASAQDDLEKIEDLLESGGDECRAEELPEVLWEALDGGVSLPDPSEWIGEVRKRLPPPRGRSHPSNEPDARELAKFPFRRFWHRAVLGALQIVAVSEDRKAPFIFQCDREGCYRRFLTFDRRLKNCPDHRGREQQRGAEAMKRSRARKQERIGPGALREERRLEKQRQRAGKRK